MKKFMLINLNFKRKDKHLKKIQLAKTAHEKK